MNESPHRLKVGAAVQFWPSIHDTRPLEGRIVACTFGRVQTLVVETWDGVLFDGLRPDQVEVLVPESGSAA